MAPPGIIQKLPAAVTIPIRSEDQKRHDERALSCAQAISAEFQQRFWGAPVSLLKITDMMRLTGQFLHCIDEFQAFGKPVNVLVGFHYTKTRFLPSIQENGLVEQDEPRHGARFGRGVYVANNAHAFRNYGTVGIIVFYLQGTVQQTGVAKNMRNSSQVTDNPCVDSYWGNKLSQESNGSMMFAKSPYFDEIILRKGRQVLPVVTYRKEIINNAELMYEMQVFFQEVADFNFNGGRKSHVCRIKPTHLDLQFEFRLTKHLSGNNTAAAPFPFPFRSASTATRSSNGQSRFPLPPSTAAAPAAATVLAAILVAQSSFGTAAYANRSPRLRTLTKEEIKCPSPSLHFKSNVQKEFYCIVRSPPPGDCAICLNNLCGVGNAVSLVKCKHMFHEKCLQQAVKYSNKCPACRVVLEDEPRGASPGGTMTIEVDCNLHCGGYPKKGTHIIVYSIPSGKQSACHPFPSQKYSGTSRTAYVPDTHEGRALLKRLKYAFSYGLTFMVGTSLTSGRKNQTCWASIHHKTRLDGGVHGYPDPGYFISCNEELDTAGVPRAEDIR